MTHLRTTHRRVFAFVLAAFWCVVPLASLLHGEHGHRYCPEHQTFEELGERADASCQPSVGGVLARAESDPEGHIECPLTPFQRQLFTAPGAASGADDPAAEWIRGLRECSDGLSAIELLALAPKQSPPRS